MAQMVGLNITVSLYHRRNNSDDRIGGASEYLSIFKTHVPARITQRRTPWLLKAQGITVETMYECVIQSPDYLPLEVTQDDVLVPESGQYVDVQMYVMEVEDTSIDDNPNDMRGLHKGLTLKKLLPNMVVV